MGFKIYYRSTRRVSSARARAILKAAESLNEGRTWLSCEPVYFYKEREDERLLGGSKPNLLPHPDDVAAAARSSLPDGTVRDMIEILCSLSRDHGVDWEIRADSDPGPAGFIRGGVCDEPVLALAEGFAEICGSLGDIPEGPGGLTPGAGPPGRGENTEGEDDNDDGPAILPFRPRDS